MERLTTRKSVPNPRHNADNHLPSMQPVPQTKGSNSSNMHGNTSKKRRRNPKPFPGKIAFFNLIHNRWFYRTILLCASLIFVVAIARSSTPSDVPSLRLSSFSSPTTSRSWIALPFPPLRVPSRIKPVDGKDLMEYVGYTAKPHVIGAYFANQTSASYLGIQILPTNIQRRLTHNVVPLDIKAIEKQIHLTNSEDYEDGMRDQFEHDSCKAQFEWMKQSFPTCNMLHEADLTNMHAAEKKHHEQVRILGSGYWRDVWKVKSGLTGKEGHSETNILKTIRYKHDFEDRNYDRHRRDALAMERLTWSPNVVDIYSFCGNSGIFEYAPGGDIDEMLWPQGDPERVKKWNSTERLVVAFQVANSIADAHNSERNGIPAIVHSDITTPQFVHVDGIYKLNDFNRCRFMAKNTVTGEPCKFYVGNNPGNFRAPEEYAYEPEDEKVDIYSMGNIFYALLTELWPFEEEETKQAQHLVMRGKRPPMKTAIIESRDPAIRAILTVLAMSWKQKPEDRATAKETSAFLEAELKKLGVSTDD